MWIGCAVISQIIFSYVGSIDSWLCSQQVVILKPDLFVLIVRYFKCSCHLAVFKMRLDSLSQFKLFGISLIHLCLFGNFGNSALKNLDIRENQFQVNRLNVSGRINRTVNMNNVVIFETADNMDDSIYFTNIGKELIAQTFTFAGTFYKACNVHKFDGGRCYLLCVIQFTEFHNSFIRNSNNTYVWVDSCKRIVGRQCAGFCQRVK